MQKIISALFIIFVCLGIVATEAQAKRFGSGRSFGMSRSVSSFSRARPVSAPFQQAATQNRNRWLGPLAGLAAGGLLASLFMGHGIASGMMSWLLVAGIIMLLLNFARSFRRVNTQPSNSNMHHMFRENAAREASQQNWFNTSSTANQAQHVPAGFDEADFLRKAKVQFIRLQAAYDQKNLQDISQFTSPDVFAEIKMQLHERGNQENVTDVVTLDAELLDAVVEYQDIIASVRFTGLIKEEVNTPAIALNEVWHFRKAANSDNWITAGIQQN